jgi:hypothetical protein
MHFFIKSQNAMMFLKFFISFNVYGFMFCFLIIISFVVIIVAFFDENEKKNSFLEFK